MASVLLAFILWLFATRKFEDWIKIVFPSYQTSYSSEYRAA